MTYAYEHVFEMVQRVYKELMLLGIISFMLFLVETFACLDPFILHELHIIHLSRAPPPRDRLGSRPPRSHAPALSPARPLPRPQSSTSRSPSSSRPSSSCTCLSSSPSAGLAARG